MVIRVQNIRLEPPYIVTKPDVSEEEYFALTNEDTNSELIEGEMIMFSPATARHEDLFRFLITILSLYVRRADLGKVFGSRFPVRLKPRTLPEPDVLFISKDRLGLITEKFLDGPADLVIEVLSKGTRRHDLGRKRPLYQEHRVPECWYVDPDNKRIMVDSLEGETYRSITVSTGRVASKVIPGFWLEAEWLWEESLPDELETLGKILGREFNGLVARP